ncbi:MAG: amidase [Dehalococcoidia bacterium]
MQTSDLCFLSVSEAASLIAQRELSPVELTEAVLARAQELDGRINAYIALLADEALTAARAAADAIAAGDYIGPWHGIPVAWKDIFATQGVRTTAGSQALADWVPDEDSTLVAQLRRAGVVPLGSLNLAEFACGVKTANEHYGQCYNPWDLERVPGGSSGGSGAAVAAGMSMASVGTDTGGSVRIPASLCGVVGLKPTLGRISRAGMVMLSWSLDCAGPITRTVRDAALMLNVLAGHDPRDPASSRVAVPDYAAAFSGVPSNYFFAEADVTVGDAVREAIRVLEGLGARADLVELPGIEYAQSALWAIMLPEAAAAHYDSFQERGHLYGSEPRTRIEVGRMALAIHYIRAQQLQTRLREMLKGVFRRYDVLITPTTPVAAPEVEPSIAGGEPPLLPRLTAPFSLVGLPAVSVPCGFTREGLPIGMQVAGRPFAEAAILNVAHTYQETTPWQRQRPPL